MITTPSASAITMSSGNTATPPHAMGSCQEASISRAPGGGAVTPFIQIGSLDAISPMRSRTAPSVTMPAMPRLAMRVTTMSPNVAASRVPRASAMAMHPGGITSTASRLTGSFLASAPGTSSRRGMKRMVKARPTVRGYSSRIGMGPRTH